MIYEFVGLPGSGKSTIFTAAAGLLQDAGFQTATMRMLAKQAVAEDRTKIGFLRRREQRVSLYGAMAFAQENPALFDLLFAAARRDLATGLWNMEMLSHLHFAAWKGLPDQPIFMDEGFLHRGAASFLLSRDMTGFHTYLDLIPSSHAIIQVVAPLDLAISRTEGRKFKKRVPVAWQGVSEAEMIGNLRYFEGLIAQGCQILRNRGHAVITIDASQSVDASSAALAKAVMRVEQAMPDTSA